MVEEYESLGTTAVVYTPYAMEMKWGNPGFLTSNIERLDNGGTLGYMSETIVKISENFAPFNPCDLSGFQLASGFCKILISDFISSLRFIVSCVVSDL